MHNVLNLTTKKEEEEKEDNNDREEEEDNNNKEDNDIKVEEEVRRAKRRPEGPKAGSKGCQLEVGPQRGPRLLSFIWLMSVFSWHVMLS